VYGHLKDKVKGTVLLHSRFNRKHRNQIEKDLQASLPKILVATQVVEVSLDLDFQQGFTEPAAIDALVQRMGRMNRRARQPSPVHVYIFTEQYSTDNRIYSEILRRDSLKALTALPMPISEESLNEAADDVYGSGYTGDDMRNYKDGLNYKQLKQFRRYLKAGTSEDWIDVVIEPNEGTIELLPESLYKQYSDLKAEGLTIAANDLLVPVGRWMIPGLIKDGRLDSETEPGSRLDPWLLKGCKYSREVGLEL
jgi:CRISPR-associated endonuclease/helicase Cas3